MKSFQSLDIRVGGGWDDEVGSSLTSYASGLASLQQKACDDLAALMNEAEQLIMQDVSYKSRITEIRNCRID